MSGHSKWKTIKYKKEKEDAKRGKIFTKVGREIVTAVKHDGGDLEANPRLRMAVQKAKDVNMPSDNIQRLIQKAAGGGEDSHLEDVTYEAYGPQGVAVLIEVLTDNKNRTLPIIRNILEKYNGRIADKGAVSYLFDKKGVIVFAPSTDENKIVDIAIENGALDIKKEEDNSIMVTSLIENFEKLREAFQKNQINFESAELSMIPKTEVVLDEENARKIFKLIDLLEEEDDVQKVHANFEVDNEVMNKLSND